jgi:CheY-like chemotaxis protein
MHAQGLILSRDERVSGVFRRVFDSAGIKLQVSSQAGDSLSLLAKNKYDAVIVNCADIDDGYDVLTALRKGNSNNSSIAFAITNGKVSVKLAYAAGATFVVEKPVTDDRVSKALRAAYGLILRERRRYLRHYLDTPMVAMFNGDSFENEVRLVNLSEGGMAFSTRVPKKIEGSVTFRFRLPESSSMISGAGGLTWRKEQSHFGLKFAPLIGPNRKELDNWLSKRVSESISACTPYKK